MASLEGWGSTIELHPQGFRDPTEWRAQPNRGVGATGLEPAVFCSQSRRASHYATPRAVTAQGSRTRGGLCSSSVWVATQVGQFLCADGRVPTGSDLDRTDANRRIAQALIRASSGSVESTRATHQQELLKCQALSSS